MKAEYADSMVAKYKAKPILDRAVLDDMEVDRSWKATGPGSIAYTSENAKTGKRALRLTTPIRSEKWIAEHRRPDGAFDGIYGNGWTYAALNFDSPQDWTAYNRISVWLYVHPAPIPNHVVAIRFHDADAPRGNTGDLESFSYYQNLVEGEWNELIWEFPEYPRTRVPALELMVQLRGNGPPATQLVYDIDRIELQRVDAEPYRGWSIREGVIAFNHVGYNLGDDKFALAGPTTAKTFQVLNAAGPVATLPIKQIRTLKGDFNVLDFSEIEKAGKYRIAVEGKPTRPFAISEAPWTETALKVLNFFYTLRCGFEVHGYHPDCHQDITAEHNGVTKTINGGWHDAGDLFQMAGRTHNILRGILELHDQAAAFRIDPGLQSKALEEAQWGLEWALKIRFGAGFRAGGFQTRFFSDNVIGTPDDTPGRVTFNAADTMSFCAAAGHAAWSIKAWDRDLALRCLSAAVEDYDAAIDKLAGPNGTIPHEVAANAVLASLDLFKATGEQRYKANAIKLGAVLLSCQEIRFVDGVPITGYFYTDTGRTQIVRDVHTSGWHLTTMATWRLCDAFPDHADWMSWYASNLIVSEYFLARGATVAAPYDYLPNAIWNETDIEAIPVGNPTRTSAGLSSSPERNAAQQKEMARAGVPIAPKTVLKTFPVWRQDNAYLDQFIPFHGGAVIQISGAGCALGAAQLRRSRSSE
jgi:hypothetical protein